MLPSLTVFLILFLVPQAQLLGESLKLAGVEGVVTVANYAHFFEGSYYLGVLRNTIWVGVAVTLICILLGYPMAYFLARLQSRWKPILLLATIFPLLTSSVVRSFGWMVLLYRDGVINQALLGAGVIAQPLPLMYTQFGVILALAEVLMPFMILTLYAVIDGIDPVLEEAAANLGASPISVLARVTIPLSLGGVVAGSVLVFSLTISSFVTPALIGGSRVALMATTVADQVISVNNWEFAAAVAMILLVTVLAVNLVYGKVVGRAGEPAFVGGA